MSERPALAQVGQAKQCRRTANRAKLDQPNFWAIRDNTEPWSDPEF